MATVDLIPQGNCYRKAKNTQDARTSGHYNTGTFIFDESAGIEESHPLDFNNVQLVTDTVLPQSIPPPCVASDSGDLKLQTAAAARSKGRTSVLMYILLLFYALLINVPMWIPIYTVFDPREHENWWPCVYVGAISYVASTATILAIAAGVYRFRQITVIKARRWAFLWATFVFGVATTTSGYALLIAAVIDAPPGKGYFPVAVLQQRLSHVALEVMYCLWVVCQTMFMATIASRQRMLYQIFATSAPDDVIGSPRDFFKMHAVAFVLTIPCFVCSILWWYGPDDWRRAHGWVMGGQLFKTFTLFLIFTYYLWLSRNLTTIYCFSVQNLRAMGLEFLFFCAFTISAIFEADQWHLFIALFFLSNILCVSFVLDAFLSTVVTLAFPNMSARGGRLINAMIGPAPCSDSADSPHPTSAAQKISTTHMYSQSAARMSALQTA